MSGGLLQILENLFRRRFWIIVLLAISFISFLVARGVSGIIAAQLAPLTVMAPTERPGPANDDAVDRESTGEDIASLLTLEEPTNEDEFAEEEPVEEEPVEEEPEEFTIRAGDCQQSSIPAILVGTMVDSAGDWSFGIVQDQRANRTSVVHPGMQLAGAEVLAVERERMWVLNEGREECLKPNEEPSPAPVASASDRTSRVPDTATPTPRERVSRVTQPEETPAPSSPSSFRDASDLRSGIRRVSPTEYEVDRAAVEAAMDNPRMLQSQAPEFQQNFDNGRPSGIRLTRIPSGSIFSAIGIRQGDVIMEVNGNRVTTVQRAMDLYDALRTESHVEVVVERRGRMRTLTYNVQ